MGLGWLLLIPLGVAMAALSPSWIFVAPKRRNGWPRHFRLFLPRARRTP